LQHAHGIQTKEEKEAWINLFRTFTPADSFDILDVGCGTGEISMILAEMGHNVSGIDLSEGMLKKAKEKTEKTGLSAQFSIGDAESLSCNDQSYDMVINRHLLWTLPNPDKALNEWYRVLRPGGTVAVIDGLWRSDSKMDMVRRTCANIGVLITERKNQFKRYYTSDMIQSLPHPYGMSSLTALEYIQNAGYTEPHLQSLKDIMDIQRKYMPISRRIGYQMPYFLITGKKSC
ncbi:MAG TPA: class I SAM-dependent methyltransferase, partial [Methanospirillum sp.]|uniref:class I SAM-dependent methyltransferase n=1 Tax=Methanospirillum sp. TaxID=45200 RepID=UPI002BA159F6